MKAHVAYAVYVLRHKWFVFIAGLRVGVPLWQLIIHDWTKFTPIEWGAYVRQFYNSDGTKRTVRDTNGAYDPNKQAAAFKHAWLHHQRNKHHWQAWISIGDNGNLSPLPMPERYAKEMVADWYGAGRAISGKWEAPQWYQTQKEKIVLHPETRTYVESILEV